MTPPIPSNERLDERSRAQERDIAALQAQIARVEVKVDGIITTLSEARGGWKVLMMVGGAGGLIGATLSKLAPWVGAGS